MPKRTDPNGDSSTDPHTDPHTGPSAGPSAGPHPGPSADPSGDLSAAVERLAGRLRSFPQRRLQAGAAATGRELARWLDREAQSLEFPGREPYVLPDDGVFVVGDQLVLAGRELVAAAVLPENRGLLAEARERVARAAREIDQARP